MESFLVNCFLFIAAAIGIFLFTSMGTGEWDKRPLRFWASIFAVFFCCYCAIAIHSRREDAEKASLSAMFAEVRADIDSHIKSGGDFETVANAKDISKIIPSLAGKGGGKYIFSIEPKADGEFGFVVVAKEKTNMARTRGRTISENDVMR